ncbi:hypothetical protein BDR07DRAFT_1422905, partial [Suillus spraguei]
MTMKDLWCLLLLSLPGVRYHNKSALTLGTHIVCTFADPNYFQILVSTPPWKVLYDSQHDRALITTMGVDVPTFSSLLTAGFAQAWYETPIPR